MKNQALDVGSARVRSPESRASVLRRPAGHEAGRRRSEGRKISGLRGVHIKMGYLRHALGSCLIEFGDTRVLCSATLEDQVPRFLRGTGKGWLTAEYGMLPASSRERIARESTRGRPSGRTQEIQRLIGRSLRSVLNLDKLGEKTLWIDADVIQGDGGTRTAAITGCFLALAEALEKKMKKEAVVSENLLTDYLAAVSVGIVHGVPLLDLSYEEDSQAEVDMNVVMTGKGQLVELQGTGEARPFSREEMNQLLDLARKGIGELIAIQKKYFKLKL